MKKGILMIHYGSQIEETRAKSNDVVDKEVKERYPDIPYYRAYTSWRILALSDDEKKEKGILTVSEALDKMLEDGIDTVYAGMTFLIPCDEYYTAHHTLERYQNKFASIKAATPALFDPSDCQPVAQALIDSIKFEPDKQYILISHGTGDIADVIFPKLDKTFKELGYPNVHMAVLKGSPKLEEAVAALQRARYDGTVVLAPYMMGAGSSTIDYIASHDSTFVTKLSIAGYKTKSIKQGVGEYPEFREIFYKKLADIMA